MLARAYIQQGDYQKAATRIDQLLAREPDSFPVLSLQGELFQHTGQFDEARRVFQNLVEQGQLPPHGYDKELRGVEAASAFHDHAVGSCSGAVVLGADSLSYRPAWLDRFSVPYDRIKNVILRSDMRAGQPVWEFQLKFDGQVTNAAKNWRKDGFILRIVDHEARDNLVTYLRKRGVAMSEAKQK